MTASLEPMHYLSIRLLRLLRLALPRITENTVGRALLLAQFSSKPTHVAANIARDDLRGYVASPAFDELLYQLAYGEEQQGAPRHAILHPLVIGNPRSRGHMAALASHPERRISDVASTGPDGTRTQTHTARHCEGRPTDFAVLTFGPFMLALAIV